MASRTTPLVAIALAALAGCASAPARFYTLTSTATARSEPPASYTVMVGPVTVPASVDRPEIVVQLAPNRVALEEFNRWASPLNESIARTVAMDLAVLLGTSRVVAGPAIGFDPAYRVTIDVQRFESIPGDAAIVEAVWAVHTASDGKSVTGQTLAREAVQGDGFEALAAAHSRALSTLSSQIAATIRAVASTTPKSTKPRARKAS